MESETSRCRDRGSICCREVGCAFAALTDSPIVPFFRSFNRPYPGGRFIRTDRDLDSWLDSADRHW